MDGGAADDPFHQLQYGVGELFWKYARDAWINPAARYLGTILLLALIGTYLVLANLDHIYTIFKTGLKITFTFSLLFLFLYAGPGLVREVWEQWTAAPPADPELFEWGSPPPPRRWQLPAPPPRMEEYEEPETIWTEAPHPPPRRGGRLEKR